MSPLLNPDTSEQLDLSPIAAGTYPCKIVKTEIGTSKTSGNPKVVAHLEVEVNGKPRPRQAHMVISGKGSGTFDGCLRSCGFVAEADAFKDPSVQPKPQFDSDQLVGKACLVIIEEQIYEGNKSDQIKGFLPA